MTDDVGAHNTAIKGLRHELKIWEKSFAAANNGRKASREDIKSDANISAKYKEYDRLTRKATKSAITPKKERKTTGADASKNVLEERPANIISRTPKRQREDVKLMQPVDLFEEAEVEATPAIVRCALGPTPQKDGEILGLFDMLPCETPSKGEKELSTAQHAALGATPSKPAAMALSAPNFSRTPQSSAKKKFLEAFAGTPLKRKRDDGGAQTPSTARRQYETPAFLRRGFQLAPIDEEGGDAAAVVPPRKKRGLVRSLSSIIQGLKKQVDERADDEWDIMNEIEAEERGEPQRMDVPRVLVEDSQAIEMPLGPDQGPGSGGEESEHDGAALDANGKPRKAWKKKGLKRQTRRVIMRPVLQKSKKASTATHPESAQMEVESVAETQSLDMQPMRSANEEVDPSNEAADDSDDGDGTHTSPRRPIARKSTKTKNDKAATSQERTTEDNDANKKPRKVSAQAHANFRRLKIKNKNSKAKGRGGRFGRR